MDDRTGRVLSGRYALEGILGAGGMGVVYRATDKLLDRTVAIKLLAADVDGSFRERFLREAKSTARVRHAGVVQVFDFGRTDDGETYLVMERLSGLTLQARMDEGLLPIGDVVRIAREIADAIAAAHAAGVVHRDLKPANVMLEDRRVVVLDFGIAKTLSADTRELTSQGAMIGTVEYMAPEQILGEAIDGKTDVYALGCLVYRMIARRLPYTAATLPELVHRHISSEPEPLAEVEGGRPVPPRLAALVLACLGKKREARPTMADVRDRLGDPAGAPIPEDAIPRSVPVPELLPRMVEAARPVVRTTEATGVHEGAPLEIEDRVASAPSQLTSRVRACPRCGVKLALYARGCHACGHSDDPFFTRMLPVEPEEGAPRNVALQFVHALPVAVHKRVFAGGLLVALLNAIFFHSSLGAYAVAAFLTAFGGLGLWLHRRR